MIGLISSESTPYYGSKLVVVILRTKLKRPTILKLINLTGKARVVLSSHRRILSMVFVALVLQVNDKLL